MQLSLVIGIGCPLPDLILAVRASLRRVHLVAVCENKPTSVVVRVMELFHSSVFVGRDCDGWWLAVFLIERGRWWEGSVHSWLTHSAHCDFHKWDSCLLLLSELIGGSWVLHHLGFFTPQTQSAVLNVFPFIQPSVLHSLSVVNRIGENDYRLVQTDPAHCMRVLWRFDARRLHSSPLHSSPHLPQTAMLCVYTCSYRFGHITALFWRN